jgi:hypothetical protein
MARTAPPAGLARIAVPLGPRRPADRQGHRFSRAVLRLGALAENRSFFGVCQALRVFGSVSHNLAVVCRSARVGVSDRRRRGFLDSSTIGGQDVGSSSNDVRTIIIDSHVLNRSGRAASRRSPANVELKGARGLGAILS